MKRLIVLCALASLLSINCKADEGMWLPSLISQRISDMQAKGFKLSAEDVYSINQASLKDAVVLFGSGCTGELVSDEGLLFTNHHCGYSYIQKHSSVEHDYLKDGFWAMSRDQELPNKGLTVSFLERMEDVTSAVLKGYDPSMTEAQRDSIVKVNSNTLIKVATSEGKGLTADVEALFYGNQYFLYVFRTYTDVRLVGAPASSIGKFGGETDNWMWPRHTCDFSMFRVYAGKDNEPADYSQDNVPMVPRQSLKVSLRGVHEGDYAMIMGYPGSTQRFMTATQLQNMLDLNDIRIDARTIRQDLMWEARMADPVVNLQYASKYAGSSNGWKKWQGEREAFAKLNVIGREKQKEADFMAWVSQNKKRVEKYGNAISEIDACVKASADAQKAYTLLTFSIAARRPRAPVLRARALRANARRASGSNVSFTWSIASSFWYCFTRQFFGSVNTRTRSSSLNSPIAVMTGRRPVNSGMRPNLMRSSGWTFRFALSTFCTEASAFGAPSVPAASKPMTDLPLRSATILSRPTNAPPTMNRMFEVSTWM